MPEDSSSIAARIKARMEEIKWPAGSRTPDNLNPKLNAMVDRIIDVTYDKVQGDGREKDIVIGEIKEIIKRSEMSVIRTYINIYERRDKMHQDQHAELRKIENGQGLRNVFWRATTTFVVAGVIFFYYWAAGHFGIQLPLLRMPL